MNMYDLIMKKRRGGELAAEEIQWMIEEYTKGVIPDYQMSAMMMAICFVGMSSCETKELTMAMAKSGEMLDLSEIHGIKVDKHSTGGVGDKTSLVLAPLVASVGVPVAKMSGRGLGHTGGTIDKLESFQGFSTSLSSEAFIQQVNQIQIALAGQTADLAPADKKLYALRDVTGTVEQLSLIASSIMSKKLASGADAIVLDVKCGDGAFMKNEEDAKALAEAMVEIGKLSGRDVSAVVSDMDQPLGFAVGNALEVKEAIDTLHGNGPRDLTELVLTLGSHMILKAGKAESLENAVSVLEDAIANGSAFEKFLEWIEAQGGNPDQALHPETLPMAEILHPVLAMDEGFVTKIDTENVGKTSLILGGGRETKESMIDLSVGLVLKKKVGDTVAKGDVLAMIHGNDADKVNKAEKMLLEAYHISNNRPEKTALIKCIVS